MYTHIWAHAYMRRIKHERVGGSERERVEGRVRKRVINRDEMTDGKKTIGIE